MMKGSIISAKENYLPPLKVEKKTKERKKKKR